MNATLRTEQIPAVFVAIDSAARVHSFLDRYGITFPVLDDTGRQIRVASLPQLVVVDSQGRPAAGWTGFSQAEVSSLQTALAQLNLEHGSTTVAPSPISTSEFAHMGDAVAQLHTVTEDAQAVAFGRSAGRPVAIVGVPGLTSALRERLLAALTPEQASWVRLIGIRYTTKQLLAMQDRIDKVFSHLPRNETKHTATGLDYVRAVIDVYTPRSNSQLIASIQAVAPPDMLSFHWGGVDFHPN